MQEQTVTYERVEYARVFNLGNYENERIGLTAKVPDGGNMLAAINKIKDDVEAVHNYRRDLKTYEHAKQLLRNPDNHYVRDVTAAKETVANFQEKYAFHEPGDSQTALGLLDAPTVEYKDDKQNWDSNED